MLAGTSAGPLAVGTRVRGTVALVEPYGVFLQLGGGGAPGSRDRSRSVRGLIPTSELGLPRGADLRKHYAPGAELEAKVVAIDERGRIRLSIVALFADEERKTFEAFEQGTKKGEKDGPRSFGTLGDSACQQEQEGTLARTAAQASRSRVSGRGAPYPARTRARTPRCTRRLPTPVCCSGPTLPLAHAPPALALYRRRSGLEVFERLKVQR